VAEIATREPARGSPRSGSDGSSWAPRTLLGEDVLDVGIGGRAIARDDVGVLEPRLHPLQVEDGEAAERREGPREAGVHHGVHRGREHRDRQADPTDLRREVDVRGLDRVRPGREGDVLEAVCRTQRVDLGAEDTAGGGLRGHRAGRCVMTIVDGTSCDGSARVADICPRRLCRPPRLAAAATARQ
jgi:hypothetical protein